MNQHCRIASVRYRDNPKISVIVPKPKTDFRDEMHNHVDDIYLEMEDLDNKAGMAWFVIVAMSFDGHYNARRGTHPESPIGRAMMPAVVGEILRNYNMEDTTKDILAGRI